MIGKYRIITLCGSTRFKDALVEAQKRLTLEGGIVLSPGVFGHSGDHEVWGEGVGEMLDEMQLRRIDLADEIYVVNVGGYVGTGTRSQIAYAQAAGKTVRYLEPVADEGADGPDADDWSSFSREEKNRLLFLRQKRTLDMFLERGAISRAQHDKSLRDLIAKMAAKPETGREST